VADRSDVLDRAFQALSDPSRRQMLDRLAGGPASVSDLAEPLRMTLAAVLQHVQVLEGSGLIESRKTGRVRMCSINEQALRRTEQWFTDRRAVWERRLDRLAVVLDEDAGPDTPAPIPKEGRRP
jgi:DNA-binding transcriptional ArsR family regulator